MRIPRRSPRGTDVRPPTVLGEPTAWAAELENRVPAEATFPAQIHVCTQTEISTFRPLSVITRWAAPRGAHCLDARYCRVMHLDPVTATGAVNRLVDEYRTRCLWSLRADYYPVSADEQLRV